MIRIGITAAVHKLSHGLIVSIATSAKEKTYLHVGGQIEIENVGIIEVLGVPIRSEPGFIDILVPSSVGTIGIGLNVYCC
jgi:hypothetical protein